MTARANLLIAYLAELLHTIGLLSKEKALRTVDALRRATTKGGLVVPWLTWRALMSALLAMGALYGGYRAYCWLFVPPPCLDPAFASVVDSMRDHPERWSRETTWPFQLQHTSGIQVEIAEYDAGVQVGGVHGDHIPYGCRAAIRQQSGLIMDSIIRRETEQAARAVAQGMTQ